MRETLTRALVLWLVALSSGTAGCVHVANYTQFSGPHKTESQTTVRQTVDVDDATTFDIVNLVLTKSSNSPPYSITLSAHDRTGTYRLLTICEFAITYEDGASVTAPVLPVSVAFDDQDVKYVAASVLDRDAGFVLRTRGYYTLADGSKMPFEENCEFEAKHVNRVLPAIFVLNGV